VEIVRDVIDGAARQDWERLLLHPYLHWQEPQVRLRGRVKVLARLAAGPDEVGLRDGQVYRWTAR
jgi:hypothetical protein